MKKRSIVLSSLDRQSGVQTALIRPQMANPQEEEARYRSFDSSLSDSSNRGFIRYNDSSPMSLSFLSAFLVYSERLRILDLLEKKSSINHHSHKPETANDENWERTVTYLKDLQRREHICIFDNLMID